MNFNLCGSVFEMDEDVWKKLKDYIESIKSRLGSTELSDDVVKDIEIRIAEVLALRTGPTKRKLNSEDIDHVISTIGRPQDFETSAERAPQERLVKEEARKHLVKNPDDKIISGVCAGFADYFNFDPLFLRVPLATLVLFAGGVVIMAYFICAFAMPAGPTRMTSEQLSVQNRKTRYLIWVVAAVLIVHALVILAAVKWL